MNDRIKIALTIVLVSIPLIIFITGVVKYGYCDMFKYGIYQYIPVTHIPIKCLDGLIK